jgi:hypothetical protein
MAEGCLILMRDDSVVPMGQAPTSAWSMASVSNRCGYPASGPGLDPNNGLVRFQTKPKTQPTDCWRVEPGGVPDNPQVSPGLGQPLASPLRFYVTGFTFMLAFIYATVNRKILALVLHVSFSNY